MTNLRLVSHDAPAAAPLITGLEEELREGYGATAARELLRYDPADYVPPRGAFLVLVADGATVAGGALRRLGDGLGEIRRVWTAPAHRGRGHARRILAALEAMAAGMGLGALRLETGMHQPAAISLYRTAGYRPIAPYGDYRDDPRVRSFEKRLG